MEIICSSPSTACSTLQSWFQCTESEIKNFLCINWMQKYEQTGQIYEMDFEDYLYKYALRRFVPIQNVSRIHWFHGTRSAHPSSFEERGIIPLNQILPELQRALDSLAEKHSISPATQISSYHGHHAFLMSIKQQNDMDQGPCAMLNLEAVTNAAQYDCHDYIDIPEIIEDYAYVKYGDCAKKLLSIYREVTSPIVVEFWSKPDGLNSPNLRHIMGTVLLYLYTVMHRYEDVSWSCCNTCYSGCGNIVDASRIVRVFKP